MNKQQVLKLGLTAVIGICEICIYINTCNNMLKNFNKPNNCNGPYYE